MQVTTAKNNVEVIIPEVETWLRNCSDMKDHMNIIMNEVVNVQSGRSTLRKRFSLSKRALKMTEEMKELRGQCKFSTISHSATIAATEPILSGTTYEFESRKQIEEDIMATLRSNDVNMIGICGMGGVGKTTMAKRITNRALEEYLFDEAVMVVVSQQIDKLKIQLEVGGSLGLKLEGETSQGRAQKLHARLTGTKRILLVFDDVWKRLVLEDLGVPCESGRKGCTVLLTSRNRDALSAMNVHKICGLQILSEGEAWFLFRVKAGACVEDSRLHSVAKLVAEECNGLPIALATVGVALRDEKNASIWEDALEQLKKSNPIDIPNIIAEVYKPLKLSYDFLDSEHAKSLFLLCCLYREDDDIPLEYLTYFCMGLCIFEDIRNLDKARNRMSALIKMLKSRCLLLDSDYKDRVRMHDIVRDVCIFIAKQKGHIDANDCTWISSFELVGGERIEGRRLLLIRNSEEEEGFEIDDTFLKDMREVYVLSIENYSKTSLPHTLQTLKNLRTLLLDACRNLETISVVGELVNLEILIFRNCEWLKELPLELGRLSRLKLLELSYCEELQSIAPGIISSLVGLEELKMLASFDKWEAEARENAGLRELESLANLTCLEIEIRDRDLAAEEIHLSSKMEKFDIRFHADLYHVPEVYNKKMCIDWPEGTCLGHWINMQLLTSTEYLYLIGVGADNLDLGKAQNMRWLQLEQCQTIRNIAIASMDDDDDDLRYGGGAATLVFPLIEYLELSNLPKLEEIGSGSISSNSFQCLKELSLINLPALKQLWKSSTNLRRNNYVALLFTNLSSLHISECHSLRNLGRLSMAAKDCLSQLEILRISRCDMMEQLFLWNEQDKMYTKMFPKLKTVELNDLPNLTTFCHGIESVEFPRLMEMYINGCPEMKSIVSTTSLTGLGSNQNNSNNADGDDDRCHNGVSHLFCQPEKVSFGNLKDLEIGWNAFCRHKIPIISSLNGLVELSISCYHGRMSLFSSSIARNLVNLRGLRISKCNEIVEVIEDEKEEEEKVMPIVFPNLQELNLSYLPQLVSFCEWKCDVELLSLREVVIMESANMKSFTLESLTTPNPVALKIDFSKYTCFTKDLNGALQQHFARIKVCTHG